MSELTNNKKRGKTRDVDFFKPPIVWFGSKWKIVDKIWEALYMSPACIRLEETPKE